MDSTQCVCRRSACRAWRRQLRRAALIGVLVLSAGGLWLPPSALVARADPLTPPRPAAGTGSTAPASRPAAGCAGSDVLAHEGTDTAAANAAAQVMQAEVEPVAATAEPVSLGAGKGNGLPNVNPLPAGSAPTAAMAEYVSAGPGKAPARETVAPVPVDESPTGALSEWTSAGPGKAPVRGVPAAIPIDTSPSLATADWVNPGLGSPATREAVPVIPVDDSPSRALGDYVLASPGGSAVRETPAGATTVDGLPMGPCGGTTVGSNRAPAPRFGVPQRGGAAGLQRGTYVSTGAGAGTTEPRPLSGPAGETPSTDERAADRISVAEIEQLPASAAGANAHNGGPAAVSMTRPRPAPLPPRPPVAPANQAGFVASSGKRPAPLPATPGVSQRPAALGGNNTAASTGTGVASTSGPEPATTSGTASAAASTEIELSAGTLGATSVPPGGTLTVTYTVTNTDKHHAATVELQALAPVGWTANFPGGKSTLSVTLPKGGKQSVVVTLTAPFNPLLAHAGTSYRLTVVGKAAGCEAQTRITSIPVAGGALTALLGAVTSPPPITLNGKRQTVQFALPIAVTDSTGSGAGWSLQLSATPFTSTRPFAAKLPATETVITGVSATAGTGGTSPRAGAISYPIVVARDPGPPTPARIYSAQPASGTGPVNLNATLEVAVPANAYVGTYNSTVQVTIAVGP